MKTLIASMFLILTATACSSLQTSVRPNVDWLSLSRVEITSANDRWNLLPVTAGKMADLGLEVVQAGDGTADLQAVLVVEETTGLAETGAMVNRPGDLTLQLFDARTGAELARSRYQLAATQSPRHGLELMISDLNKKILHASHNEAPASNQVPAEHRAAVPPADTSQQNTTESEPVNKAGTSSQKLLDPDKTDSSPWRPRFQGWGLPSQESKYDNTY